MYVIVSDLKKLLVRRAQGTVKQASVDWKQNAKDKWTDL